MSRHGWCTKLHFTATKTRIASRNVAGLDMMSSSVSWDMNPLLGKRTSRDVALRMSPVPVDLDCGGRVSGAVCGGQERRAPLGAALWGGVAEVCGG